MAGRVTNPPAKGPEQEASSQTIIKVDMSPDDQILEKQGLEKGHQDLLGARPKAQNKTQKLHEGGIKVPETSSGMIIDLIILILYFIKIENMNNISPDFPRIR